MRTSLPEPRLQVACKSDSVLSNCAVGHRVVIGAVALKAVRSGVSLMSLEMPWKATDLSVGSAPCQGKANIPSGDREKKSRS